MAEEKVKKREWVKNAAIIFLSIMLVLTFFSNTFLLRSLPEVSTQSVSSGTINTKIRGSGTVAANQTYNVTLEQNRKVDSILVKVGQKVNAGDVLFTLQEGDSKELEEAKTALSAAETAYQIKLLEAMKDTGSSGSASAAKDAYNTWKAAKDNASDIYVGLKAVNNAKSALSAAQSTRDEAKQHLVILAGGEDKLASIVNLKELLAEAERNLRTAEQEVAKAAADPDYTNPESPNHGAAEARYLDAVATRDAWNAAASDYRVKLEAYNVPETEYNVLYDKYVNAEKAVAAAQSSYDSTVAKYGELTEESYKQANEAANAAGKAYDSAMEALRTEQNNKEIQNKIDALNNSQEQKNLEKLRKQVEDLSGNNGGNEVTAKVGGTISEINVKAGSEAPAQDTLMVIELTDRGYTVSITATAEQAKKVSVGDTAEVSAYWWGSEIKATLESIKNDPSSGGKNKLLVFTLSGDVEPGQNVNLSIGQKSQNYDSIVPKSAVRSDTNGKFVLVLTQKSSPIGNRYVATRVDVKVLAEDDVSAAVTGLSYGDYVITTSSKPIEAGTLVRMAEGA